MNSFKQVLCRAIYRATYGDYVPVIAWLDVALCLGWLISYQHVNLKMAIRGGARSVLCPATPPPHSHIVVYGQVPLARLACPYIGIQLFAGQGPAGYLFPGLYCPKPWGVFNTLCIWCQEEWSRDVWHIWTFYDDDDNDNNHNKKLSQPQRRLQGRAGE